ncbi:MAG: PQQ-binding-like beta-propeller repeat protein [Phycisphaeraceae bacterium]|nr:PQQ-binding-like beta-propeller repeat protein [Phycisphaeraceae bacterium]
MRRRYAWVAAWLLLTGMGFGSLAAQEPVARPLADMELLVPEGRYALVTLDFDVPGAPDHFRQWRYVGAMRGDRITMDHGTGVSRDGGELHLRGNRLSGTFHHSFSQRNQPELKITIDARVVDGRIEGRATIGEHVGSVWGRIRPGRELAERNAIPADAAWPSFLGPVNGGVAALPTSTPLIDHPDQIELLWRAEANDIGQGIGSISRFMDGWRDASGLRTAGGSASPVLADGRVYLSYYVPAPGTQTSSAAIAALAQRAGITESDVPWYAREKVWPTLNEVVLAIDARTGETLWKATIRGRGGQNIQHHKAGPFNMTPSVGGGRVFAIGMSGNLYALDAVTGQGLWERPLGLGGGALYSATAQAVGKMVVVPYRGRWAGMEGATGRLLWHSPVPYQHVILARWSHGSGDVLIGAVSDGDGTGIVGIDAADGEVVWRLEGIRIRSGGRGLGSGGLSVHGDRLLGYVEAGDGRADAVAWALGEEAPRELWRVRVEPLHPGNVPVVVRDRFLFTADLQVVDIESGRIVARGQGARPGNGGYLQAMNDLVFVRIDGTHGRIETCIYRVAEDGSVNNLTPRRNWSPPIGAGTTSYHHPIMYPLADGRLILRQRDGLYCWDLRRPGDDPRVAAAQASAQRLAELLADDRRATRLESLEALSRMEVKATVIAAPALAAMLAKTGVDPLAERAHSLLARMADAAGPALLEATAHDRALVRRGAWELLTLIGEKPRETGARVAVASIDDPDPSVRAAARDCFASLGADAVPGLLEWIQSDDAQRRRVGFETLGRFGRDAMDALPVLLAMLEKRATNPELYEAALETLLHISPPGPLPASAEPGLRAIMLESTRPTAGLAAEYLHRYGRRMLPFFIESLDQENHTGHYEYRIILHACRALVLYGGDAQPAIPALRELVGRDWAHRAHSVLPQVRRTLERIEAEVRQRGNDVE